MSWWLVMAKRLERGFVRIILNQVSIDGNEMFYDGPLMRYENAFDILSKYKECFDSNSMFDMLLVSGAHVWLPVNLVKSAIYLPESFLGEGNE
jgi:hypothetical protein